MPYLPMYAEIFGQFQFEYPISAAAYYTHYIDMASENSTPSFRSMLKESRKQNKALGREINQNNLYNARKQLLDKGFIAEVLPSGGTNLPDLFGNERYLPISPSIIWSHTESQIAAAHPAASSGA